MNPIAVNPRHSGPISRHPGPLSRHSGLDPESSPPPWRRANRAWRRANAASIDDRNSLNPVIPGPSHVIPGLTRNPLKPPSFRPLTRHSGPRPGIHILFLILLLAAPLAGQTYYNLKYTWEEIDSLLTNVRDSIPGQINAKLDKDFSHIRLPANPGVPIIIDLPIHASPLDTEHGYILAVDSASVLRVAAHTTDGYSTDAYSVTIGPSAPDPDYTLTVAGPAVASSWDVAGADFAEWFEVGEGTRPPVGTPVVFDSGGRVRAALAGELPFGVISAGAGFVGNTGRPAAPVMLTAFGDTIRVEVRYVEVERPTVWPEPPGVRTIQVPLDRYLQAHPEADPDTLSVVSKSEPLPNEQFGKPYIPRAKDPAYVLVGLIGQIPVRKGTPTHPNWFYIRELDQEAELWLVK